MATAKWLGLGSVHGVEGVRTSTQVPAAGTFTEGMPRVSDGKGLRLVAEELQMPDGCRCLTNRYCDADRLPAEPDARDKED